MRDKEIYIVLLTKLKSFETFKMKINEKKNKDIGLC